MEYGSKNPPIIIRADQFKEWKTKRSDSRPIVRAVMDALKGSEDKDGNFEEYDIYVAHNGTRFDRNMLLSWALKFNLPVFLHAAKFIDPCQIIRRKLRLSRASLHEAIQFLGIPEKKTQIDWDDWRKAAFDGDSKSLSRIVKHCVQDVKSLSLVYREIKRVVNGVDNTGSIR